MIITRDGIKEFRILSFHNIYLIVIRDHFYTYLLTIINIFSASTERSLLVLSLHFHKLFMNCFVQK